MNRSARVLYHWIAQFADPLKLVRALSELPWYCAAVWRYRSMPAERAGDRDFSLLPVFGQRGSHELDYHYVFVGAWAARRIVGLRPEVHIDVGSQIGFTTVLSAVVPTVSVEFRELKLDVPGFRSVTGDILRLPFESGSVLSLSCLHVIEHIGLGRYGDPLDPNGSIKAAQELSRVLAVGGQLLIALPQGRPRVCFNAHRVHDSRQVIAMFSGLKLLEFSGVDDDGRYLENREPVALDSCEYGCGFYRFSK